MVVRRYVRQRTSRFEKQMDRLHWNQRIEFRRFMTSRARQYERSFDAGSYAARSGKYKTLVELVLCDVTEREAERPPGKACCLRLE